MNQWLVASLQPPHLCAMIPWEGAADCYRDYARHGGIVSNAFIEAWYSRQVLSVQHGKKNTHQDVWLGESASGPEILSEEELAANETHPLQGILDHPLDDQFYRERSPDWSKVTVPFLSAASWAGFGLHPRGNFEAFTQAASTHKWLEGHPGKHEEWFYLDEPIAMQKRFLDHFLKGIDNGWDRESSVILHLRRPFSTEFEVRKENSWPLSATRWKQTYLSASNEKLTWDQPTQASQITFEALVKPITFLSAPLERETELTGPISAKIYISSTTTDADLFVTLQAFSPEGKEVEFQGTVDPHTPLAQGWLRASHRKLNMALSTPYRPYHTHDEIQPLVPGQIYELDVEIWPTSIILPAGFRLSLQISGKDFERDVDNVEKGAWVSKGSGPWLHTNPIDRPRDIFGGKTTVYTGGDKASFLILPVIARQ
jgi:predicted acyl esterase